MTTKNETRQALNEIVGTIAAGAALAGLGALAYKTGQKKGTGLRYRAGEAAKWAARKADNMLAPLAQDIHIDNLTKAHQELAKEVGMKVSDFHRVLSQHERHSALSPDRLQKREKYNKAFQRIAEINKTLSGFKDEHKKLSDEHRGIAYQFQTLRPAPGSALHTQLSTRDKEIKTRLPILQTRIDQHTFGKRKIAEIDDQGNQIKDSQGNVVYSRALQLDPSQDPSDPRTEYVDTIERESQQNYKDAQGKDVLKDDGTPYTNFQVSQNTALETILDANPSAKRMFDRYNTTVIKPSSQALETSKQRAADPNNSFATIASKLRADKLKQRQDLASNPPKSVTQALRIKGPLHPTTVKRLAKRTYRNALIDKLRTIL